MIPSEPDFMKIPMQMPFAQVMKYPLFGTLQYRAKGFGGIIMRIGSTILLVAVIDPLMAGIRLANRLIGSIFIAHQPRVLIHPAINMGKQMLDAIAIHRNSPDRTVTLNGHQHSLFCGSLSTLVNHTGLIAGFATNIFFIQLNNAGERRSKLRARVHHFAHGMGYFPGTLLGDTDQFSQKYRRDAFARVNHVVDDQNPFPQRQLGTVHRRLGGNRKLPLAIRALIQPCACPGAVERI
jgi:hypothetical protein